MLCVAFSNFKFMAGFQALFSAQMLQPVEKLSDEEGPTETPTATPKPKPVSKSPKSKGTPKSTPKATGKAAPKAKGTTTPKNSKSTPVPKPSPTSTPTRPSALRKPATGTSSSSSAPATLKKPAAKNVKKEPQVLKCFYKATGQHGIKYQGKQLMSVPRLRIFQSKFVAKNHL